ncbi:MAG: nitroreductase family protein [Candidatus Omnitrophota bacterium]
MKGVIIFIFFSGVLIMTWPAEAAVPVDLPDPDRSGGASLMQALDQRRSIRSFDSREIPEDVLANVLWAAFGVNRADGGRTAPSAHNAQEIDIYVARSDGTYRYMSRDNRLEPVLDRDIRALAGKQDFTQQAPVNLIYVADLSRFRHADEINLKYAAADTGFISQNVYLFCASEGLATVVLNWIDRDTLSRVLGLSETQQIMLTQPVGYPGS